MILVLQTNLPGQLSVWLVQRQKIVFAKKKHVVWHGSDQMLAFVDQSLRSQRSSLQQLDRIVVVRGPGPFTAVRTGLIIANSLGWLLHIPLVGISSESELTEQQVLRLVEKKLVTKKSIAPWYGKQPNITKPKRQAKTKR